jgi:hypothetical protein
MSAGVSVSWQLENAKEQLSVKEYGISVTTMEDVFLKVASEQKAKDAARAEHTDTSGTDEKVKDTENSPDVSSRGSRIPGSFGALASNSRLPVSRISGAIAFVLDNLVSLSPIL